MALCNAGCLRGCRHSPLSASIAACCTAPAVPANRRLSDRNRHSRDDLPLYGAPILALYYLASGLRTMGSRPAPLEPGPDPHAVVPCRGGSVPAVAGFIYAVVDAEPTLHSLHF